MTQKRRRADVKPGQLWQYRRFPTGPVTQSGFERSYIIMVLPDDPDYQDESDMVRVCCVVDRYFEDDPGVSDVGAVYFDNVDRTWWDSWELISDVDD